jgi:bacterioferritin-associated ferredoxin
MTTLGSPVPAWDRLAVPEGATLLVAPLRHAEIEELTIVDDDLPQLDGASVFWAWPDGDGWAIRAVATRGTAATPWRVRAARLRIERPDPNLIRLLGIDPANPPPSVLISGEPRPTEQPPRHLACICRMTSAEQLYRAIEAGWSTVDQLKRATGTGFGVCQGRRCLPGVAARLDLSPDEPRGRMTPRPPLVPVPASVLAAFAAEPSGGSAA